MARPSPSEAEHRDWRLPDSDRDQDLIAAAHAAAVAAGEPGYSDAATGLYVFTAAALRARETCCGSDCRHCPYE
jgi:hypothetical protein